MEWNQEKTLYFLEQYREEPVLWNPAHPEHYNKLKKEEIVQKPGASCSYLNNQFRSGCNQVYNYHRLMCWDEKRGLHMDVFKVPSCCSCHVQGYAAGYPPQDFQFADKRREVIPQTQSNSGVKREIPRPSVFNGRPDVGQNILIGGKRENIRPQDFPSGVQVNPQQRPIQRPFFPQGPPQEHFPHQQQQFPPLRENQPFDHPNGHLNNVRPPFNQNNQQSIPSNQQNPQRQPGFQQQHPEQVQQQHPPQQSNIEIYGGRPHNGLIEHLVPPGPPLPLDFERPRPSFDQRKRNITSSRVPGLNVVMEPSMTNKRGTQRYESNHPSQQVRPTRPQEPAVASAAENARPQFRPPDGVFGSKIRGPKPQKNQLFVTPTTVPSTTSADFETAIRVTPKPPTKNSQKKINYNYHPIIDFFASGQAAPSQVHFPERKSAENSAPITFKSPPKQSNIVKQPPFHPAQFSQQQIPKQQQQPVVGAHEWTPML